MNGIVCRLFLFVLHVLGIFLVFFIYIISSHEHVLIFPNTSVNDDGITPVHQAASEGHVQCLKVLIDVGASIDLRDCRGNTPLDLAKLWAHRKCARYVKSIQMEKH